MSKKIIPIIIIILGVISISSGILLLNGDDSNNNENVENKENNNNNGQTIDEDTTDYEALKEKISYDDYVLENGEVAVVLKNKSIKAVYLTVEIEYLSKNNEVINNDYQYVMYFEKDKDAVVKFSNIEEEYDHYNIKINTSKIFDRKSYYNSIILVDEKDDEIKEITIIAKNTSDKTISFVSVGALFYKDGEVVAYENTRCDEIEKGKEIKSIIYYPYDKNDDNELIEFDEYKIILNEAYSQIF